MYQSLNKSYTFAVNYNCSVYLNLNTVICVIVTM